MSHFFSCHCQSLSLSLRCFYLFFYVIARLDRAIYFFSPALNIITCTLNVIAPAFFILSCPRLTGASPGFFLVTYCLTRREQPDRVIGIRSFRVNKLPQEGVAIP